MNISGGNVMAYCYDDAINSSGAITISGGNIFAMGTNNDGTDFCGYVTDATVSGGSSWATLTLSSLITTYNCNSGMGGGQHGGGGQPGQGGMGGQGGNSGGPR